MKLSIEEVIKQAVNMAKEYEEKLSETKFLLLCENIKTKEIDCLEIRFPRYAFMHLTGVSFSNKNNTNSAIEFYYSCLNRKLSSKDILLKNEEYVNAKLLNFPRLIDFAHSSKMSVVFDEGRPLLRCDRLVGTTDFSIGLKHQKKFYVPVSCLSEDVRNFGKDVFRVVAILSAQLNEKTYSTIRRVAKGVTLTYDMFPEKYRSVVDLSKYRKNDQSASQKNQTSENTGTSKEKARIITDRITGKTPLPNKKSTSLKEEDTSDIGTPKRQPKGFGFRQK